MKIKRILKYLKSTLKIGIYYKSRCKVGILEAYSNADFAGDPETQRSTSGMVCKHSDGAITWLSRKQQSVSLSTTESEFIAASEAAKKLIWLKRLIEEIVKLKENPVLMVDNVGALKFAKNPEFHKRTC